MDKNKVVVASKYFNIIQIKKLYDLGYRHFGENRTDQILAKKDQLPKDIIWHMIGHLQKNKAKDIVGNITYLHTLDSLKLAETLNKHLKAELLCFIQVNLAQIEHKNGVYLDNLHDFIEEVKKYDKIKVIGFMAMGIINDIEKTDQIFKQLFDLSISYQLPNLSIGMTNDYEIALKYHPLFIRLGSYFKDII